MPQRLASAATPHATKAPARAAAPPRAAPAPAQAPKAGWAPAGPGAKAAPVLDLRGYRTGAQDHAALRKLLGTQYQGAKSYSDALQEMDPKLKGISDENLVGLYVYSMENVPGLSYREVNRALREGPQPERARLAPMAKAVAGALAELDAYRGKAYRGAQLDASALARYVPGATVREPSFSSTSRDQKVAQRFATEKKAPAGKRPVLFTLESKGGGRELPFSRYPGEREVLFPPGAAFRVDQVETKAGVLHVRLSEVP